MSSVAETAVPWPVESPAGSACKWSARLIAQAISRQTEDIRNLLKTIAAEASASGDSELMAAAEQATVASVHFNDAKRGAGTNSVYGTGDDWNITDQKATGFYQLINGGQPVKGERTESFVLAQLMLSDNVVGLTSLGRPANFSLVVADPDTEELKTVTLSDMLANADDYFARRGMSGSQLSHDRVSVGINQVFVPPNLYDGDGNLRWKFCLEVTRYTYEETDREPKNLAFLCTSGGASVTQGQGGTYRLMHHQFDEQKQQMQGFSLNPQTTNRGVTDRTEDTAEEKQALLEAGAAVSAKIGWRNWPESANKVFTVDVPLKKQTVVPVEKHEPEIKKAPPLPDNLLRARGLSGSVCTAANWPSNPTYSSLSAASPPAPTYSGLSAVVPAASPPAPTYSSLSAVVPAAYPPAPTYSSLSAVVPVASPPAPTYSSLSAVVPGFEGEVGAVYRNLSADSAVSVAEPEQCVDTPTYRSVSAVDSDALAAANGPLTLTSTRISTGDYQCPVGKLTLLHPEVDRSCPIKCMAIQVAAMQKANSVLDKEGVLGCLQTMVAMMKSASYIGGQECTYDSKIAVMAGMKAAPVVESSVQVVGGAVVGAISGALEENKPKKMKFPPAPLDSAPMDTSPIFPTASVPVVGTLV